MSYAFEGLLHAVDFYRVDKGAKFMTFAYETIGYYLQVATNKQYGTTRRGWVLQRWLEWQQDQYQDNKHDDIQTFISDRIKEDQVSERYVYESLDMAKTKHFCDLRESQCFDVVDTTDPTAIVEDEEFQHKIMMNIPEVDRECVRLYYLEELPFTEIARRIGISPQRVRQKVVRGLTKARSEFARQGLNEEDVL